MKKEERETIIRFSPSEPTIAHVWTTERKFASRFTRAGLKPQFASKHGSQWQIPLKMILIRGKVPVKRISPQSTRHLQAARARKGIVVDKH